jgi:hypothetical protein
MNAWGLNMAVSFFCVILLMSFVLSNQRILIREVRSLHIDMIEQMVKP